MGAQRSWGRNRQHGRSTGRIAGTEPHQQDCPSFAKRMQLSSQSLSSQGPLPGWELESNALSPAAFTTWVIIMTLQLLQFHLERLLPAPQQLCVPLPVIRRQVLCHPWGPRLLQLGDTVVHGDRMRIHVPSWNKFRDPIARLWNAQAKISQRVSPCKRGREGRYLESRLIQIYNLLDSI